jgi:pyruvate dehydrogenase E2 component (dihydrolipoamide acetyltransferase)
MAKILEMPKLSPTMEEGVLSTWHKKEGDSVAVDDLLAEVETDKATMEFRAFDQGTILKLLVSPGTLVKLGQPVAVLGKTGEDIAGLVAKLGAGAPATQSEPPKDTARTPPGPAPAPTPAAAAAAAPAPTPAPAPLPAPVPAPALEPAPARTPTSLLDRTEREGGTHDEPGGRKRAANGTVLASPYVRKVAREKGIDLQGAEGSGPGGRIALADLDTIGSAPARGNTALAKPAAPAQTGALAPPSPLLAPEVRPLSMMRKTIARRLAESKRTVPHFYLTIDVDARELVLFRERVNLELAKFIGGDRPASGGSGPEKISINDLLVKACAVALTRVPECNAQFTDEAILVFRRVDISVAVAVPDGLITPVVRNADTKTVVAIAREVRDLAARARNKKLSLDEMTNGTFSISNLGMFGIDEFSAVINPPEGAILAVGRVRDEPAVVEGRVVPGKRLALTLSCDHRVVDGAVGAAFLAELRGLLESPMRILTG